MKPARRCPQLDSLPSSPSSDMLSMRQVVMSSAMGLMFSALHGYEAHSASLSLGFVKSYSRWIHYHVHMTPFFPCGWIQFKELALLTFFDHSGEGVMMPFTLHETN